MNVEIGAEAALFPEKEYIKGIFVAVHRLRMTSKELTLKKGTGHLTAG
jgi:hypothetical protein